MCIKVLVKTKTKRKRKKRTAPLPLLLGLRIRGYKISAQFLSIYGKFILKMISPIYTN
jgi:hypothetical protein